MYKNYKKGLTQAKTISKVSSAISEMNKHSSHGSTCETENAELKIDEAKQIVTECWKDIESTIDQPDFHPTDDPAGQETATAWKTVRVFVSSTFVDFHSEREILVKQVFPVLRDWCTERKLTLVVVDLRWGVPKYSPSRKTITACLEELDRCHEETNGSPFFINMLAQRYGWMPGPDDVPMDIRGRYRWVDNVSITHMEILHGAYRCDNKNAAFFFRDAEVLKNIPEVHKKRFLDTQHLPMHHMKVLKQKLKEKFPDRVIEYSSTYGGIDTSTGREKVKLEGLKDFGQQILEFLKEAIGRTYPQDNVTELTKQQEDDDVHQMLIDQKGQAVFGRDSELERLMAYIKDGQSDQFSCISENEDEFNDKFESLVKQYGCCSSDENKLVCIEGDAGIGKSALLAALAEEIRKLTDNKVWYHNVGCNPSSLNDNHILTRLICALQDHGFLEDGQTYEHLMGVGLVEKQITLTQTLEKLRNTQPESQLVLIIDGLNELHGATSPGHLSWLPPTWPKSVKCFVSVSKTHKYTIERISWRKPLCVSLQPLNTNSKAEIVTKFFKKYNKALDESQMATLLDHDGSATPLWLNLACDELRVFGDFATLSKKITSLPDSVHALQRNIFERLIKEDDTGSMSKLICLIAVSKAGLPESDMMNLLPESKDPMPLMVWATLRSCLRPFLRQASDYSQNGRLTLIQFCHQSTYQVVGDMLLPDKATELKWRLSLADYLNTRCPHHSFVAAELPYQLLEAGVHQRLVSFFRQNKISMFTQPYYKQEITNSIRCKNPILGPNNSADFLLCKMCSQKPAVLSPTLPASWACVVCGNNVNGPRTQEAKICGRHAGHRVVSPVKNCISCNNPIQKGQGLVGKLCMMCSSGSPKCCHLGS